MKKRKFVYFVGLSMLGATLASCGSVDYTSKDCSIVEPTMDSRATVKYDTQESKEELYNFYINRWSQINLGYSTYDEEQKEFFNKYESILSTYKWKISLLHSDTDNYREKKAIYNTKTDSLFIYEHYYNQTGDKITNEISVSTNIRYKDSECKEYIIASDITMNNFMLYRANNKCVSGNVKYTYTLPTGYSKIDKKRNVYDNITKIALSYNSYADVYSSEDKSYVYSKEVFDINNENTGFILKGEYIDIVEDSYISYSKHDETSPDVSFFDELKVDYFENSILDESINLNDYTELESAPIGISVIEYYYVHFVGGAHDASSPTFVEQYRDIFSNNLSLVESLTITE